jgi:hypothetical protein
VQQYADETRRASTERDGLPSVQAPFNDTTMQLLFIADPLESFKTYKDTTFAMMREAQRRGHTISACEPQDIMWQRARWCRPRC